MGLSAREIVSLRFRPRAVYRAFTRALLIFAVLSLEANANAETPPSRFRSDASFGHEVQCTPEEKLCFQFNRVLSSSEGTCLPLGTDCDVGPHQHLAGKIKLFVNRTESNIHNRFKATCRKTYCEDESDTNRLCPVPFVSYNETKELCGELPIRNNMFGDLECACAECEAPDRVVQPDEPGKCRVPDLWQSYRGPAADAIRSHCSADDLGCFSEGRVLHDGACHRPLLRGPCGAGEWLVLDEVHFVVKRQLKAVCAPRRCASPEDVWMAFSRRCHPRAEVARRVCVAGTALVEDAFGRGECVRESPARFGLPQRRQGAVCVADEQTTADVHFLAAPECLLTANGSCQE